MTSWPGSDPVYDPGVEPVYPAFGAPPSGYRAYGAPSPYAQPPYAPPPVRIRSGRPWAVVGVLGVVAAASVVLVSTGGPQTISGSGNAVGSLAGPSSLPTNTTLPPSTRSTADWVLFTDLQAHLRVKLPGTPQLRSDAGGIGPTQYTVNTAVADENGHPVEAADEDLTTPLTTAAEKTLAMREGVAGFGASSGLDKLSEVSTTFRGHPARSANFHATTGRVYTFLIFFSGDQRMYVLLAERGTPFDTLASSLQTLP